MFIYLADSMQLPAKQIKGEITTVQAEENITIALIRSI